MQPRARDSAPDFTLRDQNGRDQALADYRGRWVLLYFYPRDDTPGCTREACGIRDHFADFRGRGIEVLGVSTDAVETHAKFARKYELPFILLADTDRTVVNLYGVWGKKKSMGREYEGTHRVSFLIDPEGRIAKVYPNVKPEAHAQAVLQDQRALAVV
ncbi:MAG: thioredoxin-dependent thiol peroxidase [Gemmatimonadetes bacterium]|nr:thioredoxin-dependent thiol peroxidase [Gemmatimonadota bacterium]